MQRLSVLLCWWVLLAGCASTRSEGPAARYDGPPQFKDRQKYLLTRMDRDAVYEGGQQLMRGARQAVQEGKTFTRLYLPDDDPATTEGLPAALCQLDATAVCVAPDLVLITFADDDGCHYLACVSDQLLAYAPGRDGGKGFGFRTDPERREPLTGVESLDTLNATYTNFELNLRLGLAYVTNHNLPMTPSQARQTLGLPSAAPTAPPVPTPAPVSEAPLSPEFKAKQKYLLTEMDANAVYAACQQLLRDARTGKLSAATYLYDDPPAKRNELPEAIRKIEPTTVNIMLDLMVTMSFASPDGTQSLMCSSNEFGAPGTNPDEGKGWGFRRGALGMGKVTGTETLDELNATYDTLHLFLCPGLMYLTSRLGPRQTLEQVKAEAVSMEAIYGFMERTVAELAVKQRRLLYQTDHPELLKACRDALGDFKAGRFTRAQLQPQDPAGDEQKVTEFQRLPEAIRRLEPIYVAFRENWVEVAFMGGLGHSGAIAYAEGQKPSERDDAIQLIDGLWYYDDGLREGGPGYRDYLQSLEKEVTTPIEYRRQHPDGLPK